MHCCEFGIYLGYLEKKKSKLVEIGNNAQTRLVSLLCGKLFKLNMVIFKLFSMPYSLINVINNYNIKVKFF